MNQRKEPNTSESKGGNGDSRFEGWYPYPTNTPAPFGQEGDYFDIPSLDLPSPTPLPLPIHEPATPSDHIPVGWRPKLARRLRAMGEAVRVPDKGGLFIPAVLITLLVAMGGVFFRAGQIVQNQDVQDEEWEEGIGELKVELEKIRNMQTSLTQLEQRVETLENTGARFMEDTITRQSTIEAEQKAADERMRKQEGEHRLLRDYTEGRISGLPYRPPSG